MKLKKKSTIET